MTTFRVPCGRESTGRTLIQLISSSLKRQLYFTPIASARELDGTLQLRLCAAYNAECSLTLPSLGVVKSRW